MLFQVRLNPKDTAFRNTKFALPPFGFVLDYHAPIKTKAEVDSITTLINRMQKQVVAKDKPVK